MARRITRLLRGLGWRDFFRLLLHLPSFLKLLLRLARDGRVSLAPKLLLFGVLVYVVVPTDLLPDFLIGTGQLDDLAVILAGAKLFLRLCPAEVVEEHIKALAAGT